MLSSVHPSFSCLHDLFYYFSSQHFNPFWLQEASHIQAGKLLYTACENAHVGIVSFLLREAPFSVNCLCDEVNWGVGEVFVLLWFFQSGLLLRIPPPPPVVLQKQLTRALFVLLFLVLVCPPPLRALTSQSSDYLPWPPRGILSTPPSPPATSTSSERLFFRVLTCHFEIRCVREISCVWGVGAFTMFMGYTVFGKKPISCYPRNLSFS